MERELEELRREIDRIDRELVELFKARMQVCAEVAEYKRVRSLPVLAPDREQALLARVSELAGEELGGYAAEVYRSILSVSRAYQSARLGRGDQTE